MVDNQVQPVAAEPTDHSKDRKYFSRLPRYFPRVWLRETIPLR